MLARYWRFGLNLSPEFIVLHPFALSDLLFGNSQNTLKFGRMG
jgi:hypothetical protein